jgi:hypothetical protein
MAKQKPETEKERADVVPMTGPAQREDEPREEEGAGDEEPERLNHWQAAHRVVKQIDGDTCLSELALDADKFVVQSGGNSNDTRAWNSVWSVLQTMAELGMVELVEDVAVHPLHKLPSANGQK